MSKKKLKISLAVLLMLHAGIMNAGITDSLGELGEKVMKGTGSGNGGTCLAVGAVLGGLVSNGVSKKPSLINIGIGVIGGAAAGAVVCALVDTVQTKPAAEVEKGYKKSEGSNLPVEPKVIKHSVIASQGSSKNKVLRSSSEPVKVQSDLEIVNGTQEKINKIEEQITLKLPGTNGEKIFEKKSLDANTSGAYRSTWDLGMTPDLLKNLPTGDYQIKSTVFINGKAIDSNQSVNFSLT